MKSSVRVQNLSYVCAAINCVLCACACSCSTENGEGNTSLLSAGQGSAAANGGPAMPEPPRRETREKELREALHQMGDANEVLNSRAVAVMQRMSDKLMGRDGPSEGLAGNGAESDSVPAQVQRLIEQATSHENLCQSYIGWCPFW